MEFQDYLSILRKRWVSIFLIAALVVAAALAATLAATPQYTAGAQVYVSVRSSGTTSDLLQGSSFTQRQVSSYAELIGTPRVLDEVVEELGLGGGADELAGAVSAESKLDSSLIRIRATDADPVLAADIANATAASLATVVSELERPEGGESPVQISTVRDATPPTSPSSPDPVRNIALGVLVGLTLGFGLAVLREVLDTGVRSEADVRAVTSASVIATVPVDDTAGEHPLVVRYTPHSQRAESIRRLRTNLQFLDVSGGPQTFVVTSALPGEGKSTTSINLAISLADAGSRVALVDADLRRPSVARYMGVEGTVGLTTVLIGRAEVEDVVQPWGDGGLHVLPSGQVPPNPSELLGSRAMSDLLDRLAAEYDVVLIDTPPLLPVTDAAILARRTSGALLVVGADRLRRHQLAEALAALETVGARVLGVVVNRLQRRDDDAYTYYDAEGGPSTTSARRRRTADTTAVTPAPAPGRAAATRHRVGSTDTSGPDVVGDGDTDDEPVAEVHEGAASR